MNTLKKWAMYLTPAGMTLALTSIVHADTLDATSTAVVTSAIGDLVDNIIGFLTGTTLGKVILIPSILIGIFLLYKLVRRFTGR